MVENTEILQIKSHFDNFEQFSTTLKGWGMEFCQLDCGKFSSELLQIGIPDVLLTNAYFNRKMIQQGDYPAETRAFALMAENSTPFFWQNHQITENSFVVIPKGAGIDVASFPGFNVFTISISEYFLLERLRQWDDKASIEKMLSQGGVVEGVTEKIQELRYYLKSLFWAAEANPALTNMQAFQDELYADLPHFLFNILNNGDQRRNTVLFPKQDQLIKNIEPWLLENLQENHLVTEICKTFDVNERTLLRIFKEKYGVSTKRYLLALRLNMVRKELVSETFSRGKIAVIANRWGFWHMGDFARVYRRQFGELPTVTLHKHYRI